MNRVGKTRLDVHLISRVHDVSPLLYTDEHKQIVSGDSREQCALDNLPCCFLPVLTNVSNINRLCSEGLRGSEGE